MDATTKLLDKARLACSPPTYAALAKRLDVSRQTISQYKNAVIDLPDARAIQLAQIAHEDEAVWLVAIAADKSSGATSRAWAKAAKRLGYAAALVVALAQPLLFPSATASATTLQPIHYAKLRRWLRRAFSPMPLPA